MATVGDDHNIVPAGTESDDGNLDIIEADEGKRYLASAKERANILFVGKLGTGKSSLLNGLMGVEVATEGSGAESVTEKIQSYKLTIGKDGKELKMWDTPGFGASIDSESEGNENQLTTDKIKEIDLVLYCIDMRRRFEKSDLEELKNFSSKAGEEIWRHTIIVLTFANEVYPTKSTREENFQKVLKSWGSIIEKNLTKKLKISKKVVRDIPIVPTGYGNNSPPDRDEWFTPLWTEALKRAKPEAQPTILLVSKDRIDRQSKNCDDQAEKPQDKKVYANKKFPSYKIVIGGSATSGGLAGFVVGGGIGAGFGALGGPIGIAIGAGAGAGVGTAVGIVVGVVIAKTVINDMIKAAAEKENQDNE